MTQSRTNNSGKKSPERTVKIGRPKSGNTRTGSSRTGSSRGVRVSTRTQGRETDPAARTRKVSALSSGGGGLGERLRGLLVSRRRRALAWVACFMALGIGAGLLSKTGWDWITHTPRLCVREIVVRSGKRTPADEIKRLSGLAEGDNIIDFRLRSVVDSVEQHPWVKRASVMRELPGRVVIEVVEREPSALVSLGPLYYVDNDGEIFKRVLAGETVDYPVFTGITLKEAVDDQAGVEARLRRGLELLGIARDSLILPESNISEVRLDAAGNATVVRADDGMQIAFGRGDLGAKWRRMEQSLVELGGEAGKVAEIDLTFENRATVRLREGYQAESPSGAPPENL